MRTVDCLECGEMVSRKHAAPVRDAAGNIIGFVCRECLS